MDISYLKKRAKEMFLEDLTDESIEFYLKQEGAAPDTVTNIIEQARAEFIEEQAKKFTRQNKFFYYLWFGLALAVLVFMLFVLPYFSVVVNRVFGFALLGTIVFCFFGFMAVSHYKTWSDSYVRREGKAEIYYPLMIVLLLPGLIIYYIFAFRISSAQDSLLKETQVEAIATVTGGHSTKLKKLIRGTEVADFSTIIVEFETADGQKITTSKEVSGREFGDFYKGQQLRIIYSKNDPRNIDLLHSASSMREFKGSQERELEATDLMRLTTIPPQTLGAELNKISYGWVYYPDKGIWVNDQRKSAASLANKRFNLIGNYDLNITYPLYLERNGFTMINELDKTDYFQTGEKIYENKEFIFKIAAHGMPDSAYSVISVIKK